MGLLDGGPPRGACACQMSAALAQSTRGPPLGGIALGLGQHPAAQPHGHVLRIARVVCGVAAMDGRHGERMAQDTRQAFASAESANKYHVKRHATQTTTASRESAMAERPVSLAAADARPGLSRKYREQRRSRVCLLGRLFRASGPLALIIPMVLINAVLEGSLWRYTLKNFRWTCWSRS